jgi:ATP-dependent Clp protease ATP-binding subunit ClpC
MMFPFEQLTRKAEKGLMIAEYEAKRSGKAVGTEHILLGLMEEDTGYAAYVLKNVGVNVKDVRVEVGKIAASRLGSVFGIFGTVDIPFTTDRAARALEMSWRESRERGA